MKLNEDCLRLAELAPQFADWVRCGWDCGEGEAALTVYREAVATLEEGIAALREKTQARRTALPTLAAVRARCPGSGATAKLPDDLSARMLGALTGRCAGCILGVPVEGWSVADMEELAARTGTPFPPTEYWRDVTNPFYLAYGESARREFAKGALDHVPADDDIMYPLLNLLLLEERGLDFTVQDVADHWVRYASHLCTAELAALTAARQGVSAAHAADDNPYVEWIGAQIRADAFGYACAGNPHLAAELAYTDASFSHRGEGLYGELFAAACVAAAFVSASAEEAVERGLAEIPADCALADDIRWALAEGPKLADWRAARAAVDERFGAMSWVHVRNNTAHIVLALTMAGGDFTKAISAAVAMGRDNDCTGATVGSVMGALLGIDGIPHAWYDCFHDRIRTFLRGHRDWTVSDTAARFAALAQKFAGQTRRE